MYTLKQIPEDFIVREISSIHFGDTGKYSYFQLKKKEMNTLDAVQMLARIFEINEKKIGYAGSKDKKAITTQVCSIFGVNKERILGLKLKNIEMEFLGYGDTQISLGDLEGNEFEIVVRNLEKVKVHKLKAIINYFDEQRFSANNIAIGRHLVKKEFKEAVELIDEVECKMLLEERENDYVGALKQLPIRLLRLYVNAYQSYIWNLTVAEYLKLNGRDMREVKYSFGNCVFVDNAEDFVSKEIPIIGFNGLDDYKDDTVKKIIEKIMLQEGIDYEDFVIRQISALSLEGEMRTIAITIGDLNVGEIEEDELNKEMKKVKVGFSLGKGSYATMVVRQIVEE